MGLLPFAVLFPPGDPTHRIGLRPRSARHVEERAGKVSGCQLVTGARNHRPGRCRSHPGTGGRQGATAGAQRRPSGRLRAALVPGHPSPGDRRSCGHAGASDGPCHNSPGVALYWVNQPALLPCCGSTNWRSISAGGCWTLGFGVLSVRADSGKRRSPLTGTDPTPRSRKVSCVPCVA